jgi:hypothetical protein
MSTNLDDLPGPKEALPQHEFSPQELPPQELPSQELPPKELPLQELPSQELPRPQKRKPQPQTDDILSKIKNEFNITNLILFIFLYLSTQPFTDEYTKKLVSFILPNVNDFFITLIKCFILLIVFIIIKLFI